MCQKNAKMAISFSINFSPLLASPRKWLKQLKCFLFYPVGLLRMNSLVFPNNSLFTFQNTVCLIYFKTFFYICILLLVYLHVLLLLF